MKKIIILMVTISMMIFCCSCGTSGENAAGPEGSGTGNSKAAAPDFTAELADGSTFTLSEAEGKVVLLNFWATWCGPCCEEMPAFEKLYGEYGDELQIIAVNAEEPAEDVDAFIKENGYTFPIAYDESGQINKLYPSDGIPYTLAIGKDGMVKQAFLGAESADVQYKAYKKAIDKALQE